jgi:thiol-disulfide isomerase/thioredoxin
LLLAVLGSATVAVLPIGASETIQEITTLNELMSTVQSLGTSKKSNHPDGDLLCIKFHARRCRSCRAFAPKFSALARKYSERAHFFEMEASDELAEALQVKKTPCLQFYRYPKGHLSTIVCEPHVWPELGKHVEAFLASGVEIEEDLLQEAKKLVDEDNLEMAEQEKDDGFSP